MTLKQLICLFTVLFIINIPLLFFYYTVNVKGESQVPFLTRFNIANTGASNICGTLDLSRNNTLSLECTLKDSTIQDLQIVGIAKNDASTCRGAMNALHPDKNFIHECMNNIPMHTPD